ncbi:MAG: hypothetical protein WDN06_13000 [Asticcacaulis sp.]
MAHREDDGTHHVQTAIMVSGWGGVTPSLHEAEKIVRRYPRWPVLTVWLSSPLSR